MNVFIYNEKNELVKIYLNSSISFIREEELMIIINETKYRIKEEKDIFDFPIDCNYVLNKTKEGNYEFTFNCCKNFSLNELKTY